MSTDGSGATEKTVSSATAPTAAVAANIIATNSTPEARCNPNGIVDGGSGYAEMSVLVAIMLQMKAMPAKGTT